MTTHSRTFVALTVAALVTTTLMQAGQASADEGAPRAFVAPSPNVSEPASPSGFVSSSLSSASSGSDVTALAPQVVSTPDTSTVDTATVDTANASTSVGARALTATPTVIPGAGKRVWFSISSQQVWLVNADGSVARTYLVSGSRFGQLRPGTYSVFSRSSTTTSWNSKAKMQYMVRFARGKNAAIGFHSIPRYPSGKLAQTEAQLGLPLSDGCVRQRVSDAKALWDFAPVGTSVIVTR